MAASIDNYDKVRLNNQIQINQMKSNSQEHINNSPFNEIDDLLLEQSSPKQQTKTSTLVFKINQLQKICKTLTQANQHLIMRIEELQQQQQGKNNTSSQIIFNQEYSEMQCDFNDIEDVIKEYKNDLNKYQLRVAEQLAGKTEVIAELQKQNNQLLKNLQASLCKNDELEEDNQLLQQAKESLIIQIQQLENSRRKSKYQTPRTLSKRTNQYFDNYDNQTDVSGTFNSNVQLQLQKLIQKLIKELEHERTQKKKLSEEIKRLQKDLLDSEKQIMNKNNKIYSLQINALKNQKNNDANLTNKINSKPTTDINRKGQDKTVLPKQNSKSINTASKSFTLMELMNDCIQLTSKQKLFIALKTIELYIKKLQSDDYTSHILQSIVVSNYLPTSPNLLTIKINKEVENYQQPEEYEQTQAQVIWNLAFLLDNLFTQSFDKDKDFGQNQQQGYILQYLTHLLENRQENQLQAIIQLKKVVEEAITARKR